jgi:hypothetical protein
MSAALGLHSVGKPPGLPFALGIDSEELGREIIEAALERAVEFLEDFLAD